MYLLYIDRYLLHWISIHVFPDLIQYNQCISIMIGIRVEFHLIQWILKDKSFLRHRFLTRITTQCKKYVVSMLSQNVARCCENNTIEKNDLNLKFILHIPKMLYNSNQVEETSVRCRTMAFPYPISLKC